MLSPLPLFLTNTAIDLLSKYLKYFFCLQINLLLVLDVIYIHAQLQCESSSCVYYQVQFILNVICQVQLFWKMFSTVVMSFNCPLISWVLSLSQWRYFYWTQSSTVEFLYRSFSVFYYWNFCLVLYSEIFEHLLFILLVYKTSSYTIIC